MPCNAWTRNQLPRCTGGGNDAANCIIHDVRTQRQETVRGHRLSELVCLRAPINLHTCGLKADQSASITGGITPVTHDLRRKQSLFHANDIWPIPRRIDTSRLWLPLCILTWYALSPPPWTTVNSKKLFMHIEITNSCVLLLKIHTF